MKYVGWGLQTVGVLAILFAGFVAFQLFFPTSTNRDPIFVLNWTGLDPRQEISVIYDNESRAHWMGDYSSVYCLQIETFEPAPSMPSRWIRGADTNEIFAEVRRTAAQEEIGKCFGRAVDANSPELAVYIWRVQLFGRDQVEGADVIFYDAKTSRLLYAGFQN